MITLPVYVVVDASSSLANDIQTVNEAIEILLRGIQDDLILAESVKVAIIQFAFDSHEVLALSDVRDIGSYPSIVAGGGTDYGAAFRLLRRLIPRDIRKMREAGERVFRPVMVFITDGSPTDNDWPAALAELKAPEFRERPTIIAFGLGSADPSVLREIGNEGGDAFVVSSRLSTSEAIRSILLGLAAVLSSIVQSSTAPDGPAIAIPLSDDWLNLSLPDGL